MDEWMAGDSESQTEEKPMITERKSSCLTLLLQQVNSVGLYSLPLLSWAANLNNYLPVSKPTHSHSPDNHGQYVAFLPAWTVSDA